jgi:DNA processing protein
VTFDFTGGDFTTGAVSASERRERLRLARSETIGPVAFRELLRRYGSATRALEVLPDLARRGGRKTALRIATSAEIDQELARGDRLGARLITVGEAGFPRLLGALDPPPPLIWTRGRAELLTRPSVAVVGARIASTAGQRFARGLAADLGRAGYVVVSGLARGVDGAAHRGALESGTVAILAGGIDDIYPADHAELYAQIAHAGCLVSEVEVGRRAQAKDFPRRNRIISGLSLGVVVVEAEMRSGSLITARLAAEQGREVFAVPGSPLDPRAKGPNDLIRQGANLCEDVDDIVRVLQGIGGLREPQPDLFEDTPLDPRELDAAADRLREQAHALLSPTATPIDELVRTLDAPTAAVLAALVELSLAGRAELLPGGLAAQAEPEA